MHSYCLQNARISQNVPKSHSQLLKLHLNFNELFINIFLSRILTEAESTHEHNLSFFFLLPGDWLLILVHAIKQYRGNFNDNITSTDATEDLIESLKLKNFTYFWTGAAIVSYSIYYGIGGFLHVSF